MDLSLREKWDAIYRDGAVGSPARVLLDFAHLLPPAGCALDLACGMGANGLFLAVHGLTTQAWDISPVAVAQLQERAQRDQLPLSAHVCDVSAVLPQPAAFDVIVVSHFLDRSLMPALVAAVRPQGLLFYQTFTRERVDDSGPRNPEFRLAANELLRLCAPLHVLAYREEGSVGDTQQGWRNLAYIVAQRR